MKSTDDWNDTDIIYFIDMLVHTGYLRKLYVGNITVYEQTYKLFLAFTKFMAAKQYPGSISISSNLDPTTAVYILALIHEKHKKLETIFLESGRIFYIMPKDMEIYNMSNFDLNSLPGEKELN